MYLHRWPGWCHTMKLLPSRRVCVPHHTTMHHVTSCKATNVRCIRVSLAVTCHLHFWQNDRDLLRATAVTRGWNGYQNKSQHRKFTVETEILPPLLQGFDWNGEVSITSPALRKPLSRLSPLPNDVLELLCSCDSQLSSTDLAPLASWFFDFFFSFCPIFSSSSSSAWLLCINCLNIGARAGSQAVCSYHLCAPTAQLAFWSEK